MATGETPKRSAKPRHGTERRYRDGCHCDACRAAHAAVRRRERQNSRDTSPRGVGTTPQTNTTPNALSGPIETAARSALGSLGEGPIAAMRREVAYRAAAVMDNPKAAPFFKSAADVLRLMTEDLTAGRPVGDTETGQLAELLATFRSRRSPTSVPRPTS